MDIHDVIKAQFLEAEDHTLIMKNIQESCRSLGFEDRRIAEAMKSLCEMGIVVKEGFRFRWMGECEQDAWTATNQPRERG